MINKGRSKHTSHLSLEHIQLRELGLQDLEGILSIEVRSYSHPWSRKNFTDSFEAGYSVQGLFDHDPIHFEPILLGYFVAMRGFDEYHLLNLTVSPEYLRLGLAKQMLEILKQMTRNAALQWIWLEVRASNLAAIALYTACGFIKTGERKNYYPLGRLGSGEREDAVLMSLKI
jgi:ribosomal-protein-alanine N-acetyltransferase